MIPLSRTSGGGSRKVARVVVVAIRTIDSLVAETLRWLRELRRDSRSNCCKEED